MTEHDVDDVVREAKRLWLGIRRRFSDPRLRNLQDDLESAAIERVLRDRDTFAHLQGGERDAAIQRTLTSGALDEARLTIGSPNPHHRKLVEIVGADPDTHVAGPDDEDPTLAAAELLEALNLTGEERVIAGCYAIGCRNARDIARVTGKSTSYVRERLRTLLPYMRGMLADHVAPELDESTRQLICRYAQGELHTRRRWRERHNAQRLIANSPACLGLWHAQCAADEQLRILLPAPILAALTTQASSGLGEQAAHARGAVRQHIADAAATARRHAASLYHKAIDPTPFAGMRPGSAGAVLASCLTIGGSAAYCAKVAINHLDTPRETTTPGRHHKPRRAAR